MSAANVCVFVPEDRFQNKRDPMSHRIIEKRRRDRMNNCLANLSRLIPAIYLKKVGKGRVEKTEIIEMAIKHLKHLRTHACNDPATCEVAQRIDTDHRHQYRLGFQECMSECVRYLVDIEGKFGGDELCLRLMGHLQKHLEKLQGHGLCYPADSSTPTPGPSSLSTSAAGSATAAQVHPQTPQQRFVDPSIPILIHPPSSSLVNNARASSSVVQLESEDIKPFESEPSESAFTRRAGGTFAPRGGLLLQVPQEPAQIQQLMVPKQESRPGSAERRGLPTEIPRSPAGSLEGPTSQLREMLQTPSSLEPNMRKRSNTETNLSTANVSSCSPSKTPNITPNPNEEVYHFKKNIKERFQSNLRLFTSLPNEIVDGDDSKNLTGHEERRYSHSQVQGPVASPHNLASFSRHTVSAPPLSETETETETASCAKDLSVTGRQVKWEPGQMDSSSSSGSPPASSSNNSLPSLPRSSGSTSGYSSGSADAAPNPVLLHRQSSPSPQTKQNVLPSGVPIFALHPKGLYYIPLTMDTSLITPHMQSVERPVLSEQRLHRVSISVNYNLSHVSAPITDESPWV